MNFLHRNNQTARGTGLSSTRDRSVMAPRLLLQAGIVALLGIGNAISQLPKANQSAPGAAAGTGDPSAGLNDLYKRSMEHFAKGSYAECIAGLKDMIEQGAEGGGLESVYFTIAAAQFNLKDHQAASGAFKEYLSKYPQGEKVADALMGIGQCQIALGDKQGAIATFAEAGTKSPAQKDKALTLRAALMKESGQAAEALGLLREVVTGALLTEESVQQACLLASLEASNGSADAAIKLLSFLQQRLYSVENPLQINALAFEVGDALLGKKLLKEALRAYALVKPKREVVALQRGKLEAMVRRHKANLEAAKLAPSKAAELHQANATLMAAFEQGKKILDQVDHVEDYLVSLRLRQARAYQELGRHWECVLLLENILADAVSDTTREEVLFALSVSHTELGNSKDLESVVERYRRDFAKGKNAEAIDFTAGVLRLQKEDLPGAESVFGRMLKAYPSGEKNAAVTFLLANTRFAAARYNDALSVYEEYLKRHAKHEFTEEAQYRIALCHFFSGNYPKAHPALESYAKAFPAGVFAADALYRIAVCYQAAGEYAEVSKRCAQWEKDFQGHSLLPEVNALLGDALAAQGSREAAAGAYERALQFNPSEQVLGYALMEANKQYQKLGRWDLSARLFREFLDRHPDHPSQVIAVYWLSKSMVRDGKLEEAKRFLADKIASTISDRSRDAVEQIISQLAQLCAKRPQPVPSASNESGSGPSLLISGAAAETQPYDPAVEMRRHVSLVTTTDPLSKARLFFGEAELARLTRKQVEALKWMDRIADEIPFEFLGAALLAQTGDRLLQRGDSAKARAAYDELLKSFPNSELIDYAYNGIGQLHLAEGNAREALRWFNDAVEKSGAASKLKEVTLGKAKALVAAGSIDEAKPIFEQVAATREWRGEVTAEAVFFLGEIGFIKKDYTSAVQFFQRVFVAYQRYPAVVARAYLRAADCFEKMGEPEKALAHLREMVGREKLAGLPELETGRKRMEAMSGK